MLAACGASASATAPTPTPAVQASPKPWLALATKPLEGRTIGPLGDALTMSADGAWTVRTPRGLVWGQVDAATLGELRRLASALPGEPQHDASFFCEAVPTVWIDLVVDGQAMGFAEPCGGGTPAQHAVVSALRRATLRSLSE